MAEKNGNLNYESILVQRKFPVTLTHKRRLCEKKITSLAHSLLKSHFGFHFLSWKRADVMRLLPRSVLNWKGTLLVLLFPKSRE
jgi:hypothetical protein